MQYHKYCLDVRSASHDNYVDIITSGSFCDMFMLCSTIIIYTLYDAFTLGYKSHMLHLIYFYAPSSQVQRNINS